MVVIERLPTTPPPPGSTPDALLLTWDQRSKTRQLVCSQAGREIAVKLPTGTRLPPGTVLLIGDGFHIEVAAATEEVWHIRSADVRTLLRVAYEIGNRHFPIAIGDGSVAVLYDHTLAELWTRLGVAAQRVREPFLPDRGPSHHHGS